MTAASTGALELRPAPKHLAMLAAEMRADWDYEDIRQALIACSKAGWDDTRIYRETFRLLLIADSGPGDLRAMAAKPSIGSTGAEVNSRGKELAMQALRQATGAQDRQEPAASDLGQTA